MFFVCVLHETEIVDGHALKLEFVSKNVTYNSIPESNTRLDTEYQTVSDSSAVLVRHGMIPDLVFVL